MKKIEVDGAEIRQGPPPPFTRWEKAAILAFLRGKGIELDQLISYGKPKDRDKYVFWYA